ncbi:hypothetical protein BVC80_9033g4 [Macleaya cordata]|uniref:Protein kinase domain n=1 Tax=Macleaya cordata TaxID=56857 RepID=A0A200QYL6_MACCD|nr:hypothetical protein BVC80_9033g4 [Macleaya cordata]
MKRITIPEIKNHPWFLKNLRKELVEVEKTNYKPVDHDQPSQTVEEIMQIIQEARTPGEGSKTAGQSVVGMVDPDDDEEVDVESEVDTSGDFVSHV